MFPQIDTIILGVWPGMLKLPKITSLLFLCNILRKKWVMKLIFCMPTSMKACYKLTLCLYNISKKKLARECIFSLQMNIKVSYRLISTLWASKMPTRWYYHYCWVWSSILKVLKVISLQYLYNISKKKLGKKLIFCIQMSIKVCTSWDYCFLM